MNTNNSIKVDIVDGPDRLAIASGFTAAFDGVNPVRPVFNVRLPGQKGNHTKLRVQILSVGHDDDSGQRLMLSGILPSKLEIDGTEYAYFTAYYNTRVRGGDFMFRTCPSATYHHANKKSAFDEGYKDFYRAVKRWEHDNGELIGNQWRSFVAGYLVNDQGIAVDFDGKEVEDANGQLLPEEQRIPYHELCPQYAEKHLETGEIRTFYDFRSSDDPDCILTRIYLGEDTRVNAESIKEALLEQMKPDMWVPMIPTLNWEGTRKEWLTMIDLLVRHYKEGVPIADLMKE